MRGRKIAVSIHVGEWVLSWVAQSKVGGSKGHQGLLLTEQRSSPKQLSQDQTSPWGVSGGNGQLVLTDSQTPSSESYLFNCQALLSEKSAPSH